MAGGPAPQTDLRNLRLGAPGCDDSLRSPDEVRIIKETTQQEVDVFLQGNNIDVAAARELRNELPFVAWAVLERGPLLRCNNPSGALVARIRDAKRGNLGGNQYGAVSTPAALPANASELDKFLAENLIDQAGVASMRTESVEVQKLVMQKGPLTNTNNPSASLMARIRTVKTEMAGGGASLPGAPGGLGAAPMASGPVLSLQDSDVQEAIRKLAGVQPDASARMDASFPAPEALAAPPAPEPPAGPDRDLQAEALKAIEIMNAATDPDL